MASRRKEKPQEKLNNESGTNPRHRNNRNKNFRIKKPKSAEKNSCLPNQRLTVDDWLTRLKKHFEKLSQKQCDLIFSYLLTIRSAILSGTKNDGLEELEKFEEVKESFEYNLLIKATPYILSNLPSKETIFKWAKKLTLIRKNSWITSLFRQREMIQIMPKQNRLVFDEEGDIIDFSFTDSDWKPQINPPGHNSDPENFMLEMEIYQIFSLLTSIVGSSKKKRSLEYQRILELQLSGVDVKPRHGARLGVKSVEVASVKHQAYKIGGESLAAIFPELVGAQALYWAQKGKTWPVKRSTFKERGALYQDPYVEEKEPRTIRVWKVIDGSKGQDPNSPSLSASAINTKTSKFNKIA